ncbi:MAG: Vi polysaccharide biosynthesis UDP-N-acetylglucosamine C-6 dehydrogenase TviB [Neptuniibacter caesariensis]|uniref:Vi polysaccharide biosynthesis UDP-N-acetylglucosamine C-6 dehydrogenase TviB n=1 Tax=Neptuniibacter caesariensis TaxID=207954 RepID=A0A2G6JM76_NEPCE|nr:MAG: Vi polysaccharide biosynthesis UDP-N-acetylglucosamine C-6 dehydrogenase TviB [Neptuniibacter caesariensis]
MKLSEVKIAVIGLGYVGLPLAVEFGKARSVIGLDINEKRIEELRNGRDATLEVLDEELKAAIGLSYTSDVAAIADSNVYIVTVPTPIDSNDSPDLTPLRQSSAMLATVIKQGDIVIYESTVYPGATEEVCIPIIEKGSGLKFNRDFYAGYSPERINPGDKVNTLTKIKKITSGSTPEIATFIDELYGSIITAGTHTASSIKVAEAAKVIENTQRDLNIAIINEFAKIFNIIGIDTQEVLDAASTKWNFLPFKPGLVGGHCISVDPYYLTYKSKEVGYQPEVILAGRRINDGMGQYTATQLVKAVSKQKIHIDEARVLILGFTFKGDCPDVRNTKIVDMVKELESFNMNVDVYDPWAKAEEVQDEYGIKLESEIYQGVYDAIVLAVDHSDFKHWGEQKIRSYGKEKHVLYDVKHVLPFGQSDLRL